MYLKCVYCDLLVSLELAHMHMKTKHTENKNNCPICRARQLEYIFDAHITDEHTKEIISQSEVIKCQVCNLDFIWNDYVKHAKECAKTNDNFLCIKCKKYLKYDDLLTHSNNITCPKETQNSVQIKILDDDEYKDLGFKKRDRREILTPIGGQLKNRKR